MPTILSPTTNMFFDPQEKDSASELLSADLGYTYPGELDLRPSSALHKRLLEFLTTRMQSSHTAMRGKFVNWQAIDAVLKPCLSSDSKEALEKPGDGSKITLVYPHSYAALDTMLSFLGASFFNDPMFKYNPAGPADVLSAGLMEILINKWVSRNRVPLDLHTMFRNNLTYGFCVGVPIWLDDNNDGKVGGLDKYGCAVRSLDPYRIFPDPSCPIERMAEDGEFFGWLEQHTYNNLLNRERTKRSCFNGKYLPALIGSIPTYLDGRGLTHNLDSYNRTIWTTPVFVKLIPKEFHLGESEYPEIWFFEVAGEQVILQAHKIKPIRSMIFPIVVGADGFDGSSTTPTSRLEAIQGLQTVVDWLITSHIRQARLAVNNRMIVDPTKIEVEDLANGRTFIRTKRSGLGTDVRAAVMQLQINDVTRQHMADVPLMVSAMRDTIGTDTMAMGSLRDGGPERLTSQEANATSRGAANRFNRLLKVLHLQVMMTLGEDMAWLTKQNINKEFFVDVPVRYQHMFDGKSFAMVDKKVRDILGTAGVDITVSHSLYSSDNELTGLTSLLKIVSESPVLASMYNIPAILERIFERNGVLDISDLRLAPAVQKSVMPDEALQKGVQSGQFVPRT